MGCVAATCSIIRALASRNQNFDSPTARGITTTVVDNRSMQFSVRGELLNHGVLGFLVLGF
jgi:hypothetical protein